MTSHIDDPIVYVYCPIVRHQLLCKHSFQYNHWSCNCRYHITYIRNYIHCSQVVNEYDLFRCHTTSFPYTFTKSDIKNYHIYQQWREKNNVTDFRELEEFL